MMIILDYISVLIYGVLIMIFFLDIRINKNNILSLLGYIVICSFLHFWLYYNHGEKFIEKLYPIFIHLPLVIFFCSVLKKQLNLVLFALFTSYIFTAPRCWIGEVIASYFNNNIYVLVITKIVASIILLVIIYKYLRPYVNKILKYSSHRITLLTIVPATSYFITYLTTVYTNALYNSNMLVIGLFSIGFNCVFYLFIIAYFIEMDKGFELQMEQSILKIQIDATVVLLDEYKNAQKQGAFYRHDLHHHLNYLNGCIVENNIDEALEYITKINQSIELTRVRLFCENTSVNLILSAYEAKAINSNIHITINANTPMVIPIHSTDICVILGNGIENAIHASNQLDVKKKANINVKCIFKNKKLMIEIRNYFEGKIYFKNDIPISTEINHGLGVKSIIATVNKYHGVYSFTEENNFFIMRIIL